MEKKGLQRKLDRKAFGGFLNPVIAVAIAFMASGLVVVISGGNPIEAYGAIADGAFGSPVSIRNTLRYTFPILLLALSFSLCDRCGYFNIGQEGQMYGAVLAVCWLQRLCGGLPAPILAILMILGAMLAAGIMALIPAALKFVLHINEVVIAILLNYLILSLLNYMLLYSDIASSGTSVPMSLDIGPTLSLALILAMTVAILVLYALILRNTVPGFRLRMVGSNVSFAKMCGLHDMRLMLTVSMLGGALAGLAAAGEVLGVYHKVYNAYADGMGFMGMTAALIGKGNAIGMALGSLLLGALQSGAVNLSVITDTPAEMVLVVRGFVMLLATINILQFFSQSRKHKPHRARRVIAGRSLDHGAGRDNMEKERAS